MLPSQYPEVQSYPNLKKLLEAVVDMQFTDLRDALGRIHITSGMNLSAATRLFDTISECSICFYNATPDATAATVSRLRSGRADPSVW